MKRLSILVAGLVIVLAGYGQKINWISIEEAVKKNEETPKKILVDVYTDWCGWCKVMDKNTFNHPVIAKYVNDNFYPVKLNAEQKEDITIKGNTYKFVDQGQRGYHELAAALMNGQMSYPSIVFLDEKITILTHLPGYKKAGEFDAIMRFLGDEHFKNQSWEDFLASFTSSIKEDETQ